MRRALALVALVASLSASQDVSARVAITAEETRSYALPGMFEPEISSRDTRAAGATLWYETLGVEQASACVVVLVDGERARSLSYRHDDGPTQCLSVLAHPDGGFVVRSENPIATPEDVSAVTARVDADGALLWSLEDRELLENGELPGRYAGAHATMLYSPAIDRVLIFTFGTLSIGPQERSLTQAHALEGKDGSIEVLGRTFGDNGLGVIEGGVVRPVSGDFALHFRTPDLQGSEFYVYNGRSSISALEPLGEDTFEDKIAVRMRQDPGAPRTLLLWTEGAAADADGGLALLDDEGRPFWTADLPAVDPDITLGRPLDAFWGSPHSVVVYRSIGKLYARVIATEDGQVLGVAPLEDAVDTTPVGVVQGAGGEIRLLAMDEANGRAREYALTFEDLPDAPPMEPEPDMGPMEPMLPEIEPIDPVALACGCRQAPAPGPGPLWVGLLGLLWVLRRRKPTCAPGPAPRG